MSMVVGMVGMSMLVNTLGDFFAARLWCLLPTLF